MVASHGQGFCFYTPNGHIQYLIVPFTPWAGQHIVVFSSAIAVFSEYGGTSK
jgi:hypothetical protein